MSDVTADDLVDPPPKRRIFKVLLLALLMLALGGGGFYLAWSGMILPQKHGVAEGDAPAKPLPDIAFVAVPPIVISLPPGGQSRHLKFTAQLEVVKPHADEVALLLPRIVDVLNSYLRAIDLAEIEDPGALTRLRGQMMRRVQIVTGEGRVRDLLISEFVLD